MLGVLLLLIIILLVQIAVFVFKAYLSDTLGVLSISIVIATIFLFVHEVGGLDR